MTAKEPQGEGIIQNDLFGWQFSTHDEFEN